MRLTPPADIEVVKKEDKEARLSAFVLQYLDQLAQDVAGSDAKPQQLTVVARSIESPVLKALSTHAEAIRAHGIEVRAVVTTLDFGIGEVNGDTVDLSFADGGMRMLADGRLFEAHEQLTLGTNTVWCGDCMRREAAKRDAYERYCQNGTEATTWAISAFERLWQAAMPITSAQAMAAGGMADAPQIANATLQALAEGASSAPTALTRH